MKHIATIEIHDTFAMTRVGIVFAVRILDGEFEVGNLIQFEFDGHTLERKIKGIDIAMRVSEGKPGVGVFMETLNENEIDNLKNWNPNRTIGKIFSII